MAAKASAFETSGVGVTLLGFACAGGWALLIAVAYFANLNGPTARIPVFMAFAAAALGPIVLIMFAALAAREAARASARMARIAAIANSAAIAPNADQIDDTRELAAALRDEVANLDAIVVTTAKRLGAFEKGLREDGGVIARALAADVETIGRTRAELSAETMAVGEAVARHVEALRDATAETAGAAATLNAQIEAFGAVSAKIGARSAEFAAAVGQSSGASGKLEAAIEKAFSALAQATAMAPKPSAKIVPLKLQGPAKAENVAPPAQSSGAVIAMKRAAPSEARDLTAIVSASGVSLEDTLNAYALERIARAAVHGADARRQAVRSAAPQTMRKLSAYLRSDAEARREAETLRRAPTRAIGAETESETRRRDLASAYLLIDAVLG